MSRNACVLCLKSKKKYPGLSLHSFPRNPEIREKWINYCGFTEEDIICNRKLCSIHFEPSCFVSKPNCRKLLKPGSIPSLFKEKYNLKINGIAFNYIPTPIAVVNNDTCSCVQPTTEIIEIFPGDVYTSSPEHFSIEHDDDTSLSETPSSDLLEVEDVPIICTPDCTSIVHNNEKYLSDTQSSVLSTIEDPSINKWRKGIQYTEDIKYPDLRTPRIDKKNLYNTKLHILAQKKKIKILQQNVRRMRKRLSSIENMIFEQEHEDDILTPVNVNCGEESATNVNTSFSNTNISDGASTKKPKVQMPNTANEREILRSTPKRSRYLNTSKNDHCYSVKICETSSKMKVISSNTVKNVCT